MILFFQILMIWWVLPPLVKSCAIIIQLFLFPFLIDRILFIEVPDNRIVVFLLQEPGLSSGKDTFCLRCHKCRYRLSVVMDTFATGFGQCSTAIYWNHRRWTVLPMHEKRKDTQHKIHEKKDYLRTTGLITIPAVWRENQLLLFDDFDQVPRWWQWGTTMARQHLQGRHPSVSRPETLSNCWREIPTPRGGRYLSLLPLHKLCLVLPRKCKRVESQ